MSVATDQHDAHHHSPYTYIRCTPAFIVSLAITLVLAAWFAADTATGDTGATIWTNLLIGLCLFSWGRCFSGWRYERDRSAQAEADAENKLTVLKSR